MLKIAETFTKTVDYLTQKVSIAILLIMTVGILSLSWSTNTYVKEMLSLRLKGAINAREQLTEICLLYTSPSPRDRQKSRMPSSA